MFPETMIKLLLFVSIIITQLSQSSSQSLKHEPRIHKGSSAKQSQFPWLAYLRIFPPNDNYFVECGGTLIDEHHILTAAHCLYIDGETLVLPKNIYSMLNIIEEPWPMKNLNPIEKYYIHPEFNITQNWIMGNDLAILRLTSPSTVDPICIYSGGNNLTDHVELITAGFGNLNDDGDDSNSDLNFVKVNYINQNECESQRRAFVDQQLKNSKMNPDQVPVLLENQLCAINQKTRGDTCSGDSGGPLVYPDSSVQLLIGIITGSWTECGSLEVPGIYTWAHPYLDWIKSKGVNCCEKQLY